MARKDAPPRKSATGSRWTSRPAPPPGARPDPFRAEARGTWYTRRSKPRARGAHHLSRRLLELAPMSWRSALPRVGISETSELPAAGLAAALASAGERVAALEAYRELLL